MKLSIIVPVYNEKSTMASIIQKVLEVPLDKEIIIVDDGSTDGTTDIIKQMKDRYPEIKAYFMGKNMGKGYAIRMGLQEATGDVIVIQDADLEYDPMDFLVLIKPIMDGRADVVYGSRILGKNPKSSLSFLSNLLYGTSITDEPTCYKMFKSSVIKSIRLGCKRFEFCPEVTAKIAKKGIKIYEVPIKYAPRTKREGKKIKWKDGLIAIWTLIKYRILA
ncbi:MAG: glycosyltransferase family 2 protein [Candidatus Ratteibacteria bacterium]